MENSDTKNKSGLGWVSLGATLAGLSVMLGAFGAHSLKAKLTEKKLATFHTATDYLGYHALGLIAIGIYKPQLQKTAIAASRRIGKVEVDHGETSCKTPAAEPYILKAAKRKSAKKKSGRV